MIEKISSVIALVGYTDIEAFPENGYDSDSGGNDFWSLLVI